MSRFAWLGRARWFRPALASVIVLSVVVGVVVARDSGRREPVVVPEPIGFAITPGGRAYQLIRRPRAAAIIASRQIGPAPSMPATSYSGSPFAFPTHTPIATSGV